MPEFIYNPEQRFRVPTFINEQGKKQVYSAYQEFYDLIMNDSWATTSCWGKQRRGKSTVALWIAYFLWRMINPNLTEDELWERVYEGIIFNLSQLLYKLDDPKMHRIWDWKHKHFRIPIFTWDDFAVHSNKAITQHQTAWDEFKGSFDSLGIKFGILVFTMVNPDAPTAQLQCKYTHEIFVKKRGEFKYDEVDWEQDYRGTRTRRKKVWKQTIPFFRIPDQRFDPYDEMRNSLADESVQRVKDKMTEGIPFLLKRITESDIAILNTITEYGPIPESKRKDYDPKSIIRLKSHQLVLPTERKGRHYSLDLTPLGHDVLKEHARMLVA